MAGCAGNSGRWAENPPVKGEKLLDMGGGNAEYGSARDECFGAPGYNHFSPNCEVYMPTVRDFFNIRQGGEMGAAERVKIFHTWARNNPEGLKAVRRKVAFLQQTISDWHCTGRIRPIAESLAISGTRGADVYGEQCDYIFALLHICDDAWLFGGFYEPCPGELMADRNYDYPADPLGIHSSDVGKVVIEWANAPRNRDDLCLANHIDRTSEKEGMYVIHNTADDVLDWYRRQT